MTIRDAYRRIIEYSPPPEYTNFSVTYRLSTPLSLGHPWINGDGLVAQVLLRRLLGDLFMSLPSKNPIDTSALKLPLDQSYGCWHCSVSQFDQEAQMAVTKIYGRFDSFNIDHCTTKKKRIPIMSGHYKSRMISLPILSTKTVTFYVRGNLDECKWIFGSVPNLGKDRGKGYGQIESMKIEETPEDWSMFRDSVVMRPIPLREYHRILVPGTTIRTMNLTYVPPYWDTSRAEPCIAPGSVVPMPPPPPPPPHTDTFWDAVGDLNAGHTA